MKSSLLWQLESAENLPEILLMWINKKLRLRYWPRGSCRPSSAHRSGQPALLPGWRRRRCLLRPPHRRCWSPGPWSLCAATPSSAPCQNRVTVSGWRARRGGQKEKRWADREAQTDVYTEDVSDNSRLLLFDPKTLSAFSIGRYTQAYSSRNTPTPTCKACWALIIYQCGKTIFFISQLTLTPT